MLTKEQEEAVRHVYGPMMVVAGPGSGKTTVLTMRICELLKHTKPHRIMVITFARKAAEEMKQRFTSLTDREIADEVWFGTFHSIFFRLLREWQVMERDVKILDEEDQQALIEEISRGLESTPANFMCQRDAYEEEKKKRHLMDFEDIIKQMAEEVRVHSLYQRFDFFLIDEFQDINPLQYEIVKQMVGKQNPNIFIVGDEDQAIYAFRGSAPQLFLQVPKDFPGCRRIDLGRNFRCQAHIVRATSALISHNKDRFQKVLEAVKPKGKAVAVRRAFDERAEAKMICRSVFRRHRKGLLYSHMAVLCRTRAQLTLIKAALQEEGIPFICPYELPYSSIREELLIVEDLKKISALAREPENQEAFRNILEQFPILQEAGNFRRVSEGEDILKGLLEQRTLNAGQRRELMELRKHLQKAKAYSEGRQFINWLLQTDYLTYAYQKARERDLSRLAIGRQLWQYYKPAKDRVNSLTMHAAKGLEFDWVWVAGLVEGECPRKEAIGSPDNTEEERRLLYVAMTRAKDELTLSFYDGFSRKKSPFFKEMEKSFLD